MAKLWQSATVPARSPPLEEDLFYTQVSANGLHSVLLSDGQAVACGHHGDGRCDIPPLQEGMSYTQVSAGHEHTVLLRSDGSALAFGKNEDGQCNIPALEDGVSYIQIAAGKFHTALLRSDGQAVACGHNGSKQCNIPSLKSWSEWWSGAPATCRYVSDHSQPLGINRVFKLNWNERENDAILLTCSNVAGEEVGFRKSPRYGHGLCGPGPVLFVVESRISPHSCPILLPSFTNFYGSDWRV